LSVQKPDSNDHCCQSVTSCFFFRTHEKKTTVQVHNAEFHQEAYFVYMQPCWVGCKEMPAMNAYVILLKILRFDYYSTIAVAIGLLAHFFKQQ
jgi:hypothetical protein